MTLPRRRFLKSSGLVAAAVAAPVAARAQSSALLQAVAEAVLPEEIGPDGVRAAVEDFTRWLDGFEPVKAQNYAYLNSDVVRYGPPDPAPAWNAQLEALDLLARRTRERGFEELSLAERRELLAGELDRLAPGDALPSPIHAPHVAVALMARWGSRPGSVDLAYGARINPRGCRGLPSGAERPS